jgi:hypothetical protein
MWIIAVERLERIDGLAERQSKGAQDPAEHLHGGGLPASDCHAQFRQGSGPLIRPLQPRPSGRQAIPRQRGALRPDVDLLAPIRPAACAFRGDPVIAADVRRVHHLDCQLLRVG